MVSFGHVFSNVRTNDHLEAATYDTLVSVPCLVTSTLFFRSGAQEEIILFNSDGYRSLLDLKYGRMGGGYAIPEFGTAYVRDIRFFVKGTKRTRKADMLVSACYCVTGSPQLFDNPKTDDEVTIHTDFTSRNFLSITIVVSQQRG